MEGQRDTPENIELFYKARVQNEEQQWIKGIIKLSHCINKHSHTSRERPWFQVSIEKLTVPRRRRRRTTTTTTTTTRTTTRTTATMAI